MDVKLYLALSNKELNELTPQAIKTANKTYGTDTKETLLFDDLTITIDECYVEDGAIQINGDCKLGYVAVNIPVTDDIMTGITTLAIKRLNRLKTVIEATSGTKD